MGNGIRDFGGPLDGIRLDDFFSDPSGLGSLTLGGSEPHFDPSSFTNGPFLSYALNQNSGVATSLSSSHNGDSPEDPDDIVLSYISRMLMEEEFDVNQEPSALQAAAKPFYDILGKEYPHSPDQPPLYADNSPEDSGSSHCGNCSGGSSSSPVGENSLSFDFLEQSHSQTPSVSVDYSSLSSLSSSNSISNVVELSEEPRLAAYAVPELFIEAQSAWQFRKGVEEARKFLPSDDKLVIDLEANGLSLPQTTRRATRLVEVKEEREDEGYGSRGRKNPHSQDLDLEEQRSNKQSALFSEETDQPSMFDDVLLCTNCGPGSNAPEDKVKKESNKSTQNGQSKGSSGGKGRGKKQANKEVVDLSTLLIHCAQSVASDDRRSAYELLKQIRQHSSTTGDATQRLAHCFANGLEARLAGTGSDIYHSLLAKPRSAVDILRAYKLYMSACPFKRISHIVANKNILKLSEKATTLHIVDFGIHFGFQWPCFMQRLGARPGGPPNLRMTGIELPSPGFRPAQLVEETGRRLADYAHRFHIPFEYNAIAAKWENIRVEDIKIEKGELLVVNCLYRLKGVLDESVVAESPRNMVLNTIRKLNPDMFIHGAANGSYSAPFFVTRFREALFSFSAVFDMLETNVPREDEQRLLIERELFAKEVMNVIACEGTERVERPETYKQWHLRNLRAGFKQLPLDREVMKVAREKVKANYHKDFVVDEDSGWMLQGWKGRITLALSLWKPNRA